MSTNKERLFLFCLGLIILSVIPTMVLCQTTIGDSTFPAEEGDTYTWVCTYCSSDYSETFGIGSYMNFTIERIYQGSYMSISDALIVDVIQGRFIKATNTHQSWSEVYWVVYNSNYGQIYLEDLLYIVPIPLDLPMIAEYIESSYGGDCEITDNQIIYDEGSGEVSKYQFNSNGFVTAIIYEEDNTMYLKMELNGGTDSKISFGNHYILLSVLITGIVILIFNKKRKLSER